MRVGVDPLQFGILLIMATGIGVMMPPLGIGFHIACTVSDAPMNPAMRASAIYNLFLLLGLAHRRAGARPDALVAARLRYAMKRTRENAHERNEHRPPRRCSPAPHPPRSPHRRSRNAQRRCASAARNPSESNYHRAAVMFADEVAKLSSGKLKVDVFPNSQLGSIKEMLTAVQLGTLSMTLAVPAWYSGFVKPMDVFTLPFLIASPDRCAPALDGQLGDAIRSQGRRPPTSTC